MTGRRRRQTRPPNALCNIASSSGRRLAAAKVPPIGIPTNVRAVAACLNALECAQRPVLLSCLVKSRSGSGDYFINTLVAMQTTSGQDCCQA